METLTKKEIKRLVKNGAYIDITNEKYSTLELIRKSGYEVIGKSYGNYGMTGCLIKCRDGNCYAITERNGILFYIA